MKILNVNHFLDPVAGGGTAERTFQMSRFQARAGHQVHVLVSDGGVSQAMEESLPGVELHIAPMLERRFHFPKFWQVDIGELVRRCDIVHLMGHWTPLNALVYRHARRNKKPYVVCPAGSLPVEGRSRLLKTVYNFLVGKALMKNAARCIAVTELECRSFSGYGIDTGRIAVIPNGVDLDGIPPPSESHQRRLGLPSSPFVLFLGRLNEIKGPDLLLEAYIRSSGYRYDLVFVGPDSGMQGSLMQRVEHAGVSERVHFLGTLRGEDKFQAYHAAEALIVPSRREAMSIVAVEAGATGTPVILTDQCGFDEVEDAGGGWVVPASVEGIVAGLDRLCCSSESLKAMGARLRELVNEKYAWTSLVGHYDQLYRRILG